MIKELPAGYIDNMKSLLKEEYESYIKSLSEQSYNGLRVNTSKISVEDFEKISPYPLEKIPFVDNGFYIKDTHDFSKHPYYYAGLYYLQEPSAMLPAANLPIEHSDKVLDLCAAPGGKSTAIYAKSPELLISNDISYSRAIALTKNLELFGADNTYIVCESPDKLATRFVSYFDKILIDAPCSGEGMFRKDPSLIDSWIKNGPEYYNKIQEDILESAYIMLKSGGMIMYSTCTFSDIEDENTIYHFLSKHPDIKLCDIPAKEGFTSGFDTLNDDYASVNINKAVRIFPHKVKGEGHFLALMKKDSDNDNPSKSHAEVIKKGLITSGDEQKYGICDFLKHVKGIDFDNRIYIRDNAVYLLVKDYKNSFCNDIRYLRTGVLLGTIGKNGIITPYTGFALSIGSDNFDNVLNLSISDDRVVRYLKGETVFVNESESVNNGYVMICVDSYPLGFAKASGGKLKNMYEKGWRLL